jgi:hypothetical protein
MGDLHTNWRSGEVKPRTLALGRGLLISCRAHDMMQVTMGRIREGRFHG